MNAKRSIGILICQNIYSSQVDRWFALITDNQSEKEQQEQKKKNEEEKLSREEPLQRRVLW